MPRAGESGVIVIERFRGLNTFYSPFDIGADQFQKFSDVDNLRIGRLDKPNGQTSKSNAETIVYAAAGAPQGSGFFAYRTEYDGSNNQNSTFWWVSYLQTAAGVNVWYLRRSSGTTWANVLHHGAGGDWTDVSSTAAVDMYAVNGILRISDGTFTQSNASQWYGHIKRDIWGQSVTYTQSSKFKQPGQAAAVNAWNLKAQELVAPTITAMEYAYDKDNAINTAGEIGICIHYPNTGGTEYSLAADPASETYKDGDKYTCTFIYDYNQESELGRSGDDIGVRSLETVQNSGKRVPGLNLVVNTSSWNNRITGVNLWWQPEGDVDWYLITHLDIDLGWMESPLALVSSDRTFAALTGNPSNMGAWLPCPDLANPQNSGVVITLNNTGGTTTTKKYNASAANWETLGDPFLVGDIIFTAKTGSDLGDDVTKTDTKISAVDAFTVSSTSMDFAYNPVDTTDRYSTDPVTDGYVKVWGASAHASKISTWYIPNDNVRLSTYQGLTGREQDERVHAVRWKTSCVTDNGIAVIGNVDTKDENLQTIRERSRMMWSLPGLPDDFHILRSIDIGKDDGDTLINLTFWRGLVFAFKDRNTYIYDFTSGNARQVKHYPGYGCKFRYSVWASPYGVVAADATRIYLLNGVNEPQELSYSWRLTATSGLDSYQGLTLSNPVLGYSAMTNQLYFVNDTSEDDLVLYKYNFDLKGWSKQTLTDNVVMSNFQLGEGQEPVAMFHATANTATAKEFNTGSASTDTLTVKSGILDGGDPYREKHLKRVRAYFKAASALTINLYHDIAASSTHSDSFGTKASLGLVTKDKATYTSNQTFKTTELELSCAASDFEFDKAVIEFTWMGEKT